MALESEQARVENEAIEAPLQFARSVGIEALVTSETSRFPVFHMENLGLPFSPEAISFLFV